VKISTIVDAKEKRVAITPETVKKYIAAGLEVVLPRNCGVTAGFWDADYVAAGAKIDAAALPKAELYVAVKPSFEKDIKLKSGSHLIALLSPAKNEKSLKKLADGGVSLYSLEKIPRITRAQSMDVLSSQANIAGYRAVLEALYHYGRVAPLMMTAAGTVRPARVLVLGAGVAGLQAIATAKRLGAVVQAFDVRASVKDQVESLGAGFISPEENENGETAAGYAKEMSLEYQKGLREKLSQAIASMDVVITTAQVPGKPAPLLITEEMVQSMPAGSVIVDLATETGGNCPLSRENEVVVWENVTILGTSNLAAKLAQDSSQLFARNVFNFVSLMTKNDQIDASDEIVSAALLK
jgi:NAD(P) transhydrogenase subunit alpha